MKKTINVNLNGRVFTIDEDAYHLLDNYLRNLRIYFRKEEGASEIIADFEARIEELFSEKTCSGSQVITIEQVEEVIARVGNPRDFESGEEDVEKGKVEEEKKTAFTGQQEVKKKFFRNIDDKMFGGVCSGLSAYFGWDVLPVRIIFIVLLFATSLWIVPIYLIAWIVFPGAFTAEQKLQMRGKPITVENIGKTVAAEAGTVVSAEPKGCLGEFIDLFVGLMKVVLIGLGCLIGLPLLFAFCIVIFVLIAKLFGVDGGPLGILPAYLNMEHPILSTVSFLLVLGIPLAALIYGIIAFFAKSKPLNRSVKGTFLLIWILALILFLFSGVRVDRNVWFSNWNWSYLSNHHLIRGNGIPSEKTFTLNGPVSYVEMGKYLTASLQIEQTKSDTASIIVSGDENLIDQVKYDLQEGRLVLSALNPLRSENNLTIRLQTGDLKGIRSTIAGNIQMNRAFTGTELEINLSGPGNLQADSLYVRAINVHSEGISSIRLAGKAGKTRLYMSGIGSIDALEFPSDTVYAYVRGIGSIKCNPTDYLEGRSQGISEITYKDEPKAKNVSSEGIGRIKKE